MVPSDKDPMPVLEEAVSEIVVFKTLASNPEDIISSIACTPGFARAVISILAELLDRVESGPPNKVVH